MDCCLLHWQLSMKSCKQQNHRFQHFSQNLKCRQNLSFTNFQHLASQQNASSKRRLPSGARGWTPLHHALYRGHDAFVERLLAAGASVDAADHYGRGLGAGRVDPAFDKSVGIFPRCEFTLRIFSNFQGMTPYDLPLEAVLQHLCINVSQIVFHTSSPHLLRKLEYFDILWI